VLTLSDRVAQVAATEPKAIREPIFRCCCYDIVEIQSDYFGSPSIITSATSAVSGRFFVVFNVKKRRRKEKTTMVLGCTNDDPSGDCSQEEKITIRKRGKAESAYFRIRQRRCFWREVTKKFENHQRVE